jgi:DNA-binding MarR family transcriptional regulator
LAISAKSINFHPEIQSGAKISQTPIACWFWSVNRYRFTDQNQQAREILIQLQCERLNAGDYAKIFELFASKIRFTGRGNKMSLMNSLPNIKSLVDKDLQRNLKQFFSAYPSYTDCLEFLCKLVEPTDGFHCKFCGTQCTTRKFGGKTFRCANCKKITNVLADTIFGGKRRIVAWATRSWFLMQGYATSSNDFARAMNIAQSTADLIFTELTYMVLQEMTNMPEIYSGEFRMGFIRRSRETEARMHPVSEQMRVDQQFNYDSTEVQDDSELTESSDEESENQSAQLQLTDAEKELVKQLSAEAIHIDELTKKSGMPASAVSATLTLLELNELITRLPGDRYARKVILKELPQKARDKLSPSWALIDEFIDYIRKYHHGFSRKYLQNYLAAFWCYADRKFWNLATFAEVCSRSSPITYNDVLEYVSPPFVRVWSGESR